MPVNCSTSQCNYDNLCLAEAAGFLASECQSIESELADTVYFVDYMARFQRVVDDGCVSPTSESLVLVCDAGELSNIETNSDSIICTPPQNYDGVGQMSICQLECDADECSQLYIDRRPMGGVFGDNNAEIQFRCQSSSVNGVDASYLISGSKNSGSDGSCEAGVGGKQNLLLARLDVLCSNSTGGMSFTNDDAYSECDVDIFSLNINGFHTCLTGRVCDERQCTVRYKDVVVQADHHRFSECIQSNNVFPVPLPETFTATKPQGQYTSQFRVGAEFEYDESACGVSKNGIRVACENGGTITLLSSDPGMDCQVISNSEVECNETEASVINQGVDVAVYVSFGLGFLLSVLCGT